ncbi:hypothetical protein ACFPOC_18865, partial [Rubellimicrobium aerolatum]
SPRRNPVLPFDLFTRQLELEHLERRLRGDSQVKRRLLKPQIPVLHPDDVRHFDARHRDLVRLVRSYTLAAEAVSLQA